MSRNIKEEKDIVLAKYIRYMKKAIYNAKINYLKHQKFIESREQFFNDEEWSKLSDMDNYDHFSFSSKEIEEFFEDEKIAKAFKQLTDLQKKVMYLNVVKEIPMSSIGKFLKVSTKSVEKTKSRALKKLKNYLEGF